MSFQVAILVAEAARRLGVTDTRVRQLLRSGRLSGYRAGPREWRVLWPPDVRPGKRGPQFGDRPKRSIVEKP